MTPEERSEENHRKHKEVWNWCAETGRRKSECPVFNREDMLFWDWCYACLEADARQKRIDFECEHCPIKWAGGGQCSDKGAEYDNWEEAQTIEERKYWAKKIANKRWSKPEEG